MYELIFKIFPIIFCVTLLGILLPIIFVFIRNVSEWFSNNNLPIEEIDAKVISKRQTFNRITQDIMHFHTRTDHYITFEFKNGQRKEFYVSGDIYGLVKEQDFGKLEFQGTKYIDFERRY